jgi:hypothetical protein
VVAAAVAIGTAVVAPLEARLTVGAGGAEEPSPPQEIKKSETARALATAPRRVHKIASTFVLSADGVKRPPACTVPGSATVLCPAPEP